LLSRYANHAKLFRLSRRYYHILGNLHNLPKFHCQSYYLPLSSTRGGIYLYLIKRLGRQDETSIYYNIHKNMSVTLIVIVTLYSHMHACKRIKLMHISMKQMASTSNEKQNFLKIYRHYLKIEPYLTNNIHLAPILESHFTT